MYDIFQISYDEINAERNFFAIKNNLARKVQGIKGIHQAHIRAAELSRTEMFYVVDGDNRPERHNFSFVPETDKRNCVHLWYARNPLNGLEYGWGGIKLFPRDLLLSQSTTSLDMTTSHEMVVIPVTTSTTLFNETALSTWRSAFRECAKLSLKTDEESKNRLAAWLSIGVGRFSMECLTGAKMGHEYASNPDNDIFKINDYDWLEESFRRVYM